MRASEISLIILLSRARLNLKLICNFSHTLFTAAAFDLDRTLMAPDISHISTLTLTRENAHLYLKSITQ